MFQALFTLVTDRLIRKTKYGKYIRRLAMITGILYWLKLKKEEKSA